MTTQTLQIRRRTNGTIDIDHYRDQAVSLRRQSTCNMMRGATATSWALFGAAALIVAVIALAPRSHLSPGSASNGAAITVALEAR